MGKASRRKRLQAQAGRDGGARAPDPASATPDAPTGGPARLKDSNTSLACLGAAVGLILGTIVPPVTGARTVVWVIALPLLLLYPFIHFSLFIHDILRRTLRRRLTWLPFVIVLILLAGCVFGLVRIFWGELHPPARLNAFQTLRYDGEDVATGIAWRDVYKAVRVTVKNSSDDPMENIDMRIDVTNPSNEMLNGVNQISHIKGCNFTAPDLPNIPSFSIIGQDRQNYFISMKDIYDLHLPDGMPFGFYWKFYCPRLTKDTDLDIFMAIYPKDNTNPRSIRLSGSYEVVSEHGTRLVRLDKVVPIYH